MKSTVKTQKKPCQFCGKLFKPQGMHHHLAACEKRLLTETSGTSYKSGTASEKDVMLGYLWSTLTGEEKQKLLLDFIHETQD